MVLPRPELIRRGGGEAAVAETSTASSPKKLAKILVKVTVQRSMGPLNVVVPMESTVEDLIAAVVEQYAKEWRRPLLESTDATKFDLHYSQFSLQSLDRKEKVVELGSRNFFLCPKQQVDAGSGIPTAEGGGGASVSNPISSCSNQTGLCWLKFRFICPIIKSFKEKYVCKNSVGGM